MIVQIQFDDGAVFDAPDGADYRLGPNGWIEVSWEEGSVRRVRQYPPNAVRSVSITERLPDPEYAKAF